MPKAASRHLARRSCRTLGPMDAILPPFRYHPDPLATGAVEPSPAECACCSKQRGFIYVGPVYGERDLGGSLCPWCIADGSAARELGASFADDHPLRKANLPQQTVEEVNLRTPAFTSWQQEHWLSHCGDACAFHGDATAEEVSNANEKTKVAWQAEYGLTEGDWKEITKNCHPGGPQSLYKFTCLHCGSVLLGWDCS